MSEDRVKGHCPTCGPDKWANVKSKFDQTESDGDVTAWTKHRILQCPACDAVYHQTNYSFSEDWEVDYDSHGDQVFSYNETITHWPPPTKRSRPFWLDKLPKVDADLYLLLDEVYSALEQELLVLAAIGIRTAFDRGSELLSVDPARSFAEKLDALVKGGHIGATEKDALSVMADAGSASAHRGWRPNDKQLETMLLIIEGFVHRSFILRDDVSGLKNAVPARPKRKLSGTSP